MWTGSSGGTTVTFVVSDVDDTTVLSDLTIHCKGAFGAANDENDEHIRHEAAIDAAGRIIEQIEPRKRRYQSPGGNGQPGEAITGHLETDAGWVSVDGDLATGPQGFVAFLGHCNGTQDIEVEHVSAHLMEDGTYEVKGSGDMSGTFGIWGQGALLEWEGKFRTPIGFDPDAPEINCAESKYLEVWIDAWWPIYPTHGGTFGGSGINVLLGTATLAGHYIGSDRAIGTWAATMISPLGCTGAGVFHAKLVKAAPPLVPLKEGLRRRPEGGHRPAPPPEPTLRYVALGDSYSSGEGVPPYEPETDTKTDQCHRSKAAYSQLLQLPGVRLKRSFFACSGATTDDVLDRSRGGEPPQVDRPQLRGANLVTISIGGNDALFSKVVAKCTRAWPVPCYRGGAARKTRELIGSLGPRLTRTYEKIKGLAAKGARVVVLGYPNLMPPANVSCGKLSTVFSTPARKFMRELGGQLAGVIAAAAQKAGVRYLDVREAFADHEFCSKDEWIHFIVRGSGPKPSTASFHPTAAGQAAYVRVLEGALR